MLSKISPQIVLALMITMSTVGIGTMVAKIPKETENKTMSEVTVSPTLAPTATATSEPQIEIVPVAAKKSVLVDGKCIITLFDVKYDVTSLASTNVFDCGGDMTATYRAKYGTNVTRMAAYLAVKPNLLPTTAATVIPTQIPAALPTATAVTRSGDDRQREGREEHDD